MEQQGHEVKIVPTTFRFMDGATHFLQITK
ncbi:MAG: hypothetical protein K0R47_2918 [Brevibacillus sp.]|nr:hypothetical protein [Brevibacillus sp.]